MFSKRQSIENRPSYNVLLCDAVTCQFNAHQILSFSQVEALSSNKDSDPHKMAGAIAARVSF
jgi:hypothetical protein